MPFITIYHMTNEQEVISAVILKPLFLDIVFDWTATRVTVYFQISMPLKYNIQCVNNSPYYCLYHCMRFRVLKNK